MMEPNILFEDAEILVCIKPAGVAVQSARVGEMDMESLLRNYLAMVSGGPDVPYLGLVHRLDQPVRGVMVFAKTRKSAASLSAQAADGRMKKIYQALVEGNPAAEEGHLTDWLLKDGRTNTSRIVPAGTKGAKKAELKFRVLERLGDGRSVDGSASDPDQCRTRVEVELLSGRHHQIRVQMAGAGMPLAGDRKYGRTAVGPAEPGANDAVRHVSLEHVALCAVRLTFLHPKTGKKMTFTCEPDF